MENISAIGYAKDMSAEDLVGKHIDSLSGLVFSTEEDYLNHVSPITGHKPVEPEHLGPEFLEIQKASLERAKEREEVDNVKQDEAIAEVQSKIDSVSTEEIKEPSQSQEAPIAPIYQAK